MPGFAPSGRRQSVILRAPVGERPKKLGLDQILPGYSFEAALRMTSPSGSA